MGERGLLPGLHGQMDLDLTALPPEVQAQFNEHLACLAKLCSRHHLDANQVGQAVTKAVTKRLTYCLCEDCNSKCPSFGILEDGEQKRRWCSGCAKSHLGSVSITAKFRKQCEDCGLKIPSFGMVDGQHKMVSRWCSGCAKAHGAVSLPKQKKKACEDCGLKVPEYGSKDGQRNMRWCSRCSEAHAGAVNLSTRKKCEDCGLKKPSFGMADGPRKLRWCSGCAEVYGAVNLRKPTKKKPCEDCALNSKNYGLEHERKVRWCGFVHRRRHRPWLRPSLLRRPHLSSRCSVLLYDLSNYYFAHASALLPPLLPFALLAPPQFVKITAQCFQVWWLRKGARCSVNQVGRSQQGERHAGGGNEAEAWAK